MHSHQAIGLQPKMNNLAATTNRADLSGSKTGADSACHVFLVAEMFVFNNRFQFLDVTKPSGVLYPTFFSVWQKLSDLLSKRSTAVRLSFRS